MLNKVIPAVYIYDFDTGQLKQFFNLYYEEASKKDCRYAFACDGVQLRMLISPDPEVIFENADTHSIVLWLNHFNRDKAIDLISKYILDRISPEIKAHRCFRHRVDKEYWRAIKLLETIPEV